MPSQAARSAPSATLMFSGVGVAVGVGPKLKPAGACSRRARSLKFCLAVMFTVTSNVCPGATRTGTVREQLMRSLAPQLSVRVSAGGGGGGGGATGASPTMAGFL